ncbi:hypothetical protein ACEPAH_1170 [Sanghuangporus vaninii]
MAETQTITTKALRSLHAICTAARIDYVVLGGAACIALGSYRATEDVDIVVNTEGQDIQSKIQALQASAGQRFTISTDRFGAPLYKLDGVEVEIFDPSQWPLRPQYGEFLKEQGRVFVGGCYVVSPPLLLREKLATVAERRSAKTQSDKIDIEFLLLYCKEHGHTLDLRGSDPICIDARKGLLHVADQIGMYPGVVIQ